MAIDTENKRRSVQGYTIGGIMPVPDGTVGTTDRPSLAWLYAGISYAAVAAITDLAAQFHARFHLHHNMRPFN
jgi:hypothetical protein